MRSFNKPFYIAMGERIKNLRLGKNLSREKFSIMADISDKFLYDIEVGNKGISADTLCRICKALDVSADWLLKGDGGDSENQF